MFPPSASPGATRDIEDQDLVYFLLNVGDADCQLLLLPAETDAAGERSRRAIVVDVGRTSKLPALVAALRAASDDGALLRRTPGPGVFPIVVGTHPHDDHLRGMPEFFERFGQGDRRVLGPRLLLRGSAYIETMSALEGISRWVQYTQPTSGMTRFVGVVKVVTLSPGIGLRNRFDSYGVTPNNASISLKIEFPHHASSRDEERRYLRTWRPQVLILGADAQTLSWAQVVVDFPEPAPRTHPSRSSSGWRSGRTRSPDRSPRSLTTARSTA